ncbi:ATP-binding cassette domain-containing protein [Blautia sp. XA-2221]|uniref:ATP-binding cassette domain-containing protein n=1 Tax=Blautia sp. XA-2221 TaxID=2903961 RepID=UPI0023796435|nr:ATP-binding cassette domain-containing protein [Blautia sp. XA-2221]
MDIVLENVCKQYGKKKIIDHLNLHIPSGKIYGFIGLNGAGKTTTMKMLTGLTPVSSGTIKFSGKTLQEIRKDYRAFGAFISSPSYYKNLTAYENLAMIQKVLEQPVSEVDRVLDIVGLSNSKQKRVSEFSFGMKQRLGLAFAFLNNPEVLILDEPTNGLDPEGIVEIRNLLYDLSKIEGKTIFISSHNIAELEQISDVIGIIQKGKMVFQGSLETLYNESGLSYCVEVDDEKKMKQFLEEAQLSFEVERNLFEVTISKKDIPDMLWELQRRKISVYEIAANRNLEKIFLKIARGVDANATGNAR